jgi:hypothetical protein
MDHVIIKHNKKKGLKSFEIRIEGTSWLWGYLQVPEIPTPQES